MNVNQDGAWCAHGSTYLPHKWVTLHATLSYIWKIVTGAYSVWNFIHDLYRSRLSILFPMSSKPYLLSSSKQIKTTCIFKFAHVASWHLHFIILLANFKISSCVFEKLQRQVMFHIGYNEMLFFILTFWNPFYFCFF